MTLSDAYVLAMARHLPPSSAELRLLDVGGAAGAVLRTLRADLITAAVDVQTADENSMDAVTWYQPDLSSTFLAAALRALRPGGRLIMVDPEQTPAMELVNLLERAGYVRILAEPALESGEGLLLRGEKPHVTASTLERIQQVASGDDSLIDLSTYRGRYVFLLIRQTPNKPIWALHEGERVVWDAVGAEMADVIVALAFSSLPKAVAFMQPAVLTGRIRDVHKVAKFSRETAQAWPFGVLMNPTPDSIEGQPLVFFAVDAAQAEAADE